MPLVRMKNFLLLFPILAAPVVGCGAILGLDDFVDQDGGSGGDGGGPVACMSASECPGASGPCVAPQCAGGLCAEVPIGAGIEPPIQTPNDCKTVVCDGAGNAVPQLEAGDLPDDSNDCTEDLCDASSEPSHPFFPPGTPCGETGTCNDTGQCNECEPGMRRCQPGPQLCSPAGQWQDEPPCPGHAPECVGMGQCTAISCVGVAPICGPAADADCCATGEVPGGTFNRGDMAAFPATVSAFRLDTYEVTVGRFRAFVETGTSTQTTPPANGAGAHPAVPDSGWNWNDSNNPDGFTLQLPPNIPALKTALACDPALATWSDAPAGREDRPINCVTWYEAFAFCIWDGGRLPTETEWHFAGSGGDEQRKFPWGDTTPDITYASYFLGGGSQCGGAPPPSVCDIEDFVVAGSRPQGNGRWGHADLGGNVGEWTLDVWLSPDYEVTWCVDCAFIITTSNTQRAHRGGAFNQSAEPNLQNINRGHALPATRSSQRGFRCVKPTQ